MREIINVTAEFSTPPLIASNTDVTLIMTRQGGGVLARMTLAREQLIELASYAGFKSSNSDAAYHNVSSGATARLEVLDL